MINETQKGEVWQAFKPSDGDIILLNPLAFDGDKKDLKKCPRIKFNDYNSFSIANENEYSCGRIIDYVTEYYNLKEIIKILIMFLTRKPKQGFIKFLWTHKNWNKMTVLL